MTIAALQSKWKSYANARDLSGASIETSEVPLGHYIALPVPTLRWKRPVWACFSAPSSAQPGKSNVGLPDRWWALDAARGALVAYAFDSIVPVLKPGAETVPHVNGKIELKQADRTVGEAKIAMARVSAAFDLVSEPFFEGREAPASNRAEALAALKGGINPELMPFYRALAPDFFAWLER